MPNDFEKAGSVGKPTRFRALSIDRVAEGLWTQRSPLRDGSSPLMQQRFYGSRMDAMIDGANVEVSNRLTLQRRPGHTVYNSHSFPEIDAFYSFRQNTGGTETIKVLADTGSYIYSATGPSTGSAIFTKSGGAGQSSFLSVVNVLYSGNGLDAIQWDGTTVSSWGTAAPPSAPNTAPLAFLGAGSRYWGPDMLVVPGYAILDANGNIQLMTGLTNTAQYLTQTLSGTITANGGTLAGDFEGGVDQGHNWQSGYADAYSNGSASVDGSPDTCAAVELTHTHAYRGIHYGFSFSGDISTIIGGKINILSSIDSPNGWVYTARDASMWYSLDDLATHTKIYQDTFRKKKWDAITVPPGTDPAKIIVIGFCDSHDTMGHQIFEVNLVLNLSLDSVLLGTSALTTGSKVPTWNTSLFGNTTDGTAIWVNMGPISQWQPKTTYSTDGPSASVIDSNGNLQVISQTGGSGAVEPTWETAPGATTIDGTVHWLNCGPGNVAAFNGWQYVYGFHTTSDHVSTVSPASNPTGPVLGKVQIPLTGVGSLDPACDYVYIFRILDGGATFMYDDKVANPSLVTVAAIPAALTAQGVSFLSTAGGVAANNVTIQLISTGTADATAITTTGNAVVVDVKKSGGALRTVSEIVALFATYGATRAITTSGGVIQATGAGAGTLIAAIATHLAGGVNSYQTAGTWTFVDTHPDADLNEFLTAPIAHGNDMPPAGLTNLCFHLGRIWGSTGCVVQYTRVTDATAGKSLESFPPNNYITFPSKVTKLYAAGMGLLVFTISDVWLVMWQGTSNSIIQVVPYLPGIGLLSPNAFDVNGSLIYMHTSDGQVISFDPSSGISEIGFPIGDQITWAPTATYLTWHVSGSADKAIYLADGSTGWYRCNPVSAPETGLSWSPKATIAGGIKCVQSVEVSPGVKRLLVAPTGGGPILQRDQTTFTDNGATYSAHATIGSLVLANPGQMAELVFVSSDCTAVGSHPTMGVRLDETSGAFESMPDHVADPPQLAASASIHGDRFYFSQTGEPAWCRHLQLDISWPAEAYKNELLSYTLFGATWNE